MELYSPQQVAEILGVTRRSVYRYIKEGRLPAIRFVSQIRVKESDLERFVSTPAGPAKGKQPETEYEKVKVVQSETTEPEVQKVKVVFTEGKEK